jgi:nucleotide-binding universal stress UspA family protein
MDFSDHAQSALDYALCFAKEYEAEFVVLHVWEDFLLTPQGSPNWRAKVGKLLEESLPPEALDSPPTKLLLRRGKPHQEVMYLVLETQAHLVIMGVRGHGSLDSALFGSTACRVIQFGPCPVLAGYTFELPWSFCLAAGPANIVDSRSEGLLLRFAWIR